jgi:murein DD-endopeptidase MepM/ murein hydrolase activator NlpD
MICLVAYQLLSKGSKKPSNNVKFINMRPILLRFFRLFLGVVLIFLLAACASATMEVPAPEATATLPLAPTATAVIKSSITPSPTATQTVIPTQVPQACAPLEGMQSEQILALVSNPYHPPPPGSDDPHHGVDIAVQLPGSSVAVPGHTIQAVFPGRVAGVVRDRFPYGSAVLVETTLTEIPNEWLGRLEIPTPAPTLEHRSPLTCPPASFDIPPAGNDRSLYILYAHMETPPEFSIGDEIACGQEIGSIGSSGNARNPHLHFEARVGPAGLQLDSMAHYDSSATAAEMSAYCLWRISGVFQLVEPTQLILLAP